VGEQPDVAEPSWRYRRRAIFGSMAFGVFVIVWVLVRWDDTRLAETLALGAFGLIGTAVGFYAGAAAYQDVRLWPRRTADWAASDYDRLPPMEDGHV